MPTYGGTPVLTPDQAEAAAHTVDQWFAIHGYEESEHPTMYKPGHEGPMWVLSLEGGGDDVPWPIQVCDDLRDKWPDGVFAEPVNHWCLGLYPA